MNEMIAKNPKGTKLSSRVATEIKRCVRDYSCSSHCGVAALCDPPPFSVAREVTTARKSGQGGLSANRA